MKVSLNLERDVTCIHSFLLISQYTVINISMFHYTFLHEVKPGLDC